MSYTMIRRIWLSSGICVALNACTDTELRAVVDACERYLPLLNRGKRDSEERVELEDWRKIVLGELLTRQLLRFDRRR